MGASSNYAENATQEQAGRLAERDLAFKSEIYGHPPFCKRFVEQVIGLLKSIRRLGGEIPRATMRVAPDGPQKSLGLYGPLL